VVLAAFQLAGDRLAAWTHAPIPGSVIGMVLLTAALESDLLPMRWVRDTADLLLRHLVLFYVPAGVGLVAYVDVFRRAWLPITVGGLASLLAVLVVVGRTSESLDRRAE
jgi:holin-like protein